MKWLLNKVEADFENKLIHSAVLKWIIIIGGGVSLGIVGMIIYNSWGAELCTPIFSGECLSNFSYNMQLPAKLITATLALSGFWALIFRSHQTSEQIKTSQKQTQLTIDNNTFNNYISHKKAFNELLEEIEEQHKCKILNKSYVYRLMFPSNSPMFMYFKCNINYFNNFESNYKDLLNKFSPIASEIVKIDPRIEEEEPVQENDIQNFKFINKHMQDLKMDLKSLHIEGTRTEEVIYQDFDESGAGYMATVTAPTDLSTLLWVITIMRKELSKFSNAPEDESSYPSPEIIKAINIYNLSVRVVRNA